MEGFMRSLLRLLPFASLAILGPHLALAQDSVDAEIRKRVAQYEAFYNAGDGDSLAAIYAPNGSHTDALGVTQHGRAEIASSLKELFSGPFKGSQMALRPLRIRAIAAGVAVEEAAFSVTGIKDPGGATIPPVQGLCLAIYSKVAEQWFAEAVQCMVPPPLPPTK
jgi:uncharacterized protein (TIGR02246 family)